MGEHIYVIETKGRCFLCLSRGSPPKSSPVGGSHATGVQETEVTTVVQQKPPPKKFSLLKIFQYLKLNFRELLTQTMNILSPSHLEIKEEMKLGGALCEECTHLAERIYFYLSEREGYPAPAGALELEVIQMKLHFYVKSLHDRMSECDQEVEGRLEEFKQEMRERTETLVQYEVVGRLRRKIVERCSLKLANPSPQVTVQRLSEEALSTIRWRSPQMMECDVVKEEQADEVVVTGYSNDFEWDVVNEIEAEEGYPEPSIFAIPNDTDKPNEIFECDKCGKISTKLDSLNQHRRLFHPDKVSKNLPHVPSKNPARITIRVVDNRKFPKPPPGIVVAPTPIEEIPNSTNLSAGVLKPKGTRYFFCFQCDMKFTKQVNLIYHQLRKVCGIKVKVDDVIPELNRGIKFKCILCDNSFPRKNDLLKHRRVCRRQLTVADEEEPTTDPDPVSDRLRPRGQASLNSSCLKPKIVKCSRCPLKFTHSLELQSHFTATHLTKYQCVLCKQVFLSRSSFSEHHRMVHKKTNYKCGKCDKTFCKKQTLRRHQQSGACGVVVEDWTKERSKKRCSVCHLVFRNHTLDLHMKNVHRDHKFKCDLCDKTYNSRQSLYHHRRCVHFCKQEKCKFCFKSFAYQSLANRHMEKCPLKGERTLEPTIGASDVNNVHNSVTPGNQSEVQYGNVSQYLRTPGLLEEEDKDSIPMSTGIDSLGANIESSALSKCKTEEDISDFVDVQVEPEDFLF